MSLIAPSGPVYQAGTLSGNPLAMSAGIATLRVLQRPGVWAAMEAGVDRLTAGVGGAAHEAGVPIQQTRVGTMFCTFFTETPVRDWPTAKTSDTARFGRFFTAMLEGGAYLAPSQFEAAFFSTTHSDEVVDKTIQAARAAFRATG